MHAEAAEAGTVVERMLARNHASLRRIAARLPQPDEGSIVTCGRGSSANAALYGRHLLASRLGLIGMAANPSTSSVYRRASARAGDVFFAVSQSGRSEDLLEATRHARRAGALTVGIVNVEDAPLVEEVDEVVTLCAGPEQSVASTKTFISTQSVFAALTAYVSASSALVADLDQLPAHIDQAFALDWSAAIPPLSAVDRLFVLARGPSMGTAAEIALKLKEVGGIHAEAISAAEVMHGPVTLMRRGSLAIVLSQEDAARDSISVLLQRLIEREATVLFAGPRFAGTRHLPLVPAASELTPILTAQSFYGMVADLSVSLGLDPDRPSGLSKVTMTV